MDIHIPDIWIGFCLGNVFCIVFAIALWKIAVNWSDKQKEKKLGKK